MQLMEFTTSTGQHMMVVASHVVAIRNNMSGKTFILVSCGVEFEINDPDADRFRAIEKLLEGD